MTLSIPVWLIVLIVSLMPFVGVNLWAAYVRKPGGDWDFGIDVFVYGLLSIMAGMVVWIVYLAVT